jgi:DNA polymerase III sliding clamp (beta) subunit (PCNA family)
MIDYKVFMKHAEKVTKNASETRPVLKGVMHLENGTAVVTDSHRLYVAKSIHDRQEGAVITPAGKKVDGNYPDVFRIVPDSSYAKYSLQIEIKELLRAADMIASIGDLARVESKSDKPPALDFKEDTVRYVSPFVNISYTLPVQFQEPICANAIYVLEAMKLLKAAGCQEVTFNYFGAMRPFTFTNEDEDLLILILPIRKY